MPSNAAVEFLCQLKANGKVVLAKSQFFCCALESEGEVCIDWNEIE